ncbi:hypothetical protein HPP92_015931 [Vanilla planifolia]|uniref:Uncharacterized protein n=1 Tax=Vanilla planifolia TaxID=51239 RepID=A0A835QQD8_VANPL|nr:hypothetical protein HPP92_015931 [Vanilla planifolia]
MGICNLSSISVEQRTLGRVVNGKAEYEVVVLNSCICSQSSLLLSCRGFNTVEPVDPQVFGKVDGEEDECVVNNYAPVFQGNPVAFRYAWDRKIELRPLSSVISCS